MPYILTIIVTYNGKQWICNCLSALRQSNVGTRVLIIDNASTDETADIIRDQFAEVELIINKENKGFGAANNIGLLKAIERNADYVFLLNQDAYVHQNTISVLLERARQLKNYGILSPVQLNGSGTAKDAKFKIYFNRTLSRNINNQQLNNEVVPVRFVNAAAWFIPAQAVKVTGLFHPLFYHYGEDNNYCSRMQYHHYKVGICTDCFVNHDRINEENSLLKKIKTISRYSVTDIRKPLFAAYAQACIKLLSLTIKSVANRNSSLQKEIVAGWRFLFNAKEILSIRKEMKLPFTVV